MSTTMHAGETTVPAWKMAQINRPFFKDLVFHSDRGVQDALSEFREGLDPKKATQSMSKTGNCSANAMAETSSKS